eukprot:478740-Amphidinium_carterae.5
MPLNELVKGFAAAPVLLQDDPSDVDDERVTSLEEAVWSKIVLEDGAPAWLHEGDVILSLVCPCIVDVAEVGPFPFDVANADLVSIDATQLLCRLRRSSFMTVTRRCIFELLRWRNLAHFCVKSITVRTADRLGACVLEGILHWTCMQKWPSGSSPVDESDTGMRHAVTNRFNLGISACQVSACVIQPGFSVYRLRSVPL